MKLTSRAKSAVATIVFVHSENLVGPILVTRDDYDENVENNTTRAPKTDGGPACLRAVVLGRPPNVIRVQVVFAIPRRP